MACEIVQGERGVRAKLVACVSVLGSRRDPFATDYYLNVLQGSGRTILPNW